MCEEAPLTERGELADFDTTGGGGCIARKTPPIDEAHPVQANVDAGGFFDLLLERFARL
jgi:hypothetical protein